MKKALIAMSGGVDSSLSAKLMIDAGYECVGCTMKLHNYKADSANEGGICGSLSDVEDAAGIAGSLGMEHNVFDFTDGFKEKVIKHFVDAYEAGRTPNPCIDCNRFMKFEKLLMKADELDCEVLVTGHYARVEKIGDKYFLKKALDETKDQSYVLYSLTQKQLSRIQFPLGSYKKSDVRALAKESSFVNADKPDSQDICFVPDGDYGAFLERETGKKYPEGDFIGADGSRLGTHKGIVNYTIGQRKGLGIALGRPIYVTNINTQDNTVTLSDEKDLFERALIASDFNWTSGEAPAAAFSCKAKVRYRQKEQPAVATLLSDGRVKIVFDEPQRAITAGQAAVLYDGDIVIGGGTIDEVIKED